MAPLNAKRRKAIPKAKFAIPSKAPDPGSYPIDTRARAANALARSKGKPEEAQVKRAVCRAYPDLPECQSSSSRSARSSRGGSRQKK